MTSTTPVFVTYSPDGKTVLTGSHDRTARLWDATTGKPVGTAMQHEGAVEEVAALSSRLLLLLETTAPPKNREEEAAKAKARTPTEASLISRLAEA